MTVGEVKKAYISKLRNFVKLLAFGRSGICLLPATEQSTGCGCRHNPHKLAPI